MKVDVPWMSSIYICLYCVCHYPHFNSLLFTLLALSTSIADDIQDCFFFSFLYFGECKT